VSVPRHDDWLADGGRPVRDSYRPGSADGRDNGVQSPDHFGVHDIAFGLPEQSSSLVRPYAVTGGRTKPSYQLQIEAMVSASHYEARDLSVLSP
jgi:uncharacterized protein DUF742